MTTSILLRLGILYDVTPFEEKEPYKIYKISWINIGLWLSQIIWIFF